MSRAADYFRRRLIRVTDILSKSCSRSPHPRLMFRRAAIRSIWRPLRQFLAFGLLLVALTIRCYRLHLNLATGSLLYAAVVVFVSRTGTFFSAIAVSIVASLCLAHLAPPAYSFRVGDPFDDLAIVVFLIISWIVAGLVATLRRTLKETLSSVNRKLIDAEERVRNRIGKDLDANIAQRLALIGIKLDEVGRDVPSSAGNILTPIKELQEQTARAAAEVMTLSHELRSYKIEFVGIDVAIRTFCRDFGAQQKSEIDFRSYDLPTLVPMEISVSLFRVYRNPCIMRRDTAGFDISRSNSSARRKDFISQFTIRVLASIPMQQCRVKDLA